MRKLKIEFNSNDPEPYQIYEKRGSCLFFERWSRVEKTKTLEEAKIYVEGRGKSNIYVGIFENGKRIPEDRALIYA